MEIRKYLQILKRRKWVLVLTALTTILTVGAGSFMMPPTYSASTTLRIAQAYSGSLEYLNYMYAERLMNTYVEILRSRPMLEEVIERLELSMMPEDLAKRIKVEALADTELIRISVEDGNPRRARDIANTLATLLIEQSQSLYSGGGKSAREILQEQLKVTEDNLEQGRANLQSLMNRAASAQGEIEALSNKIRLEEETYAMLLRQYEEARVAEAMRASSTTVVEPAIEPEVPSGPRKKLNIALGALVGLAGGVGLAFLFENLDQAIHSADDLEAVAKVPLLGRIPSFIAPRGSRRGTILLDSDGQSPASEAFRILRTNILSLTPGTPPKTLLIASAEPGAGKSTVLANLAVAMAQAGRSVVVVDSDFRHPCLHQVFDLPNELGLSNIILDLSRVDTTLQETKIEGVRVLTSGSLPPSPAELLGSSKMKELIRELAKEADMVLLDSPPILAVADAAALASMVDGVLLVAARDQTTGRGVQRALQQLDKVGARTLGIVFNKAKAGDGDYYYSLQYGNGSDSRSSLMTWVKRASQRNISRAYQMLKPSKGDSHPKEKEPG